MIAASVGPRCSRVRSAMKPWLSWMHASCSEMPRMPVKVRSFWSTRSMR
jgi:hypothetical protein